MKIKKLARDTYAVGSYELGSATGYLAAGTLVRAVKSTRSTSEDGLAGDVITTFQASTDGGVTWYDQRAYEKLVCV